ncbi:MAG: UDP-N-acetylmuramate dehydrogenase [Cyclobacteriaceae bacterium]|nr:UDP-N-acetylmuramate dehydrogenase [Cyclobacteriaceae bacterium]
MVIKNDFSLQKLNTFGLNVTAKHFVELNSTDDVIEFFKSERQNNERTLILGGGSNLLFTKDFDGFVIKINIGGIHVVKEDEHHFWVKAGAGVIWHDLVESCIKANFGGIENLSLIPGTVGAAPIQNIGAYGVEIKDTFEALEASNLETGEKKYFKNQDCNFGYRDSIFKNELIDKYLITNVILRLTKQPILHTNYGKIQEVLHELAKEKITIEDISDAIIKIRQSKLPDPEKVGNAGSFFKNPIIPIELLNALKKSYPNIPSYEQPGSLVKLPAAWLIDQCHFKGMKHKGAAVHINQPLVLINHNNASGRDIVELSMKIQQKIKNEFGITLEPEVRII